MRFFSRRRTHDDFAAEVQSHLDLETDRLIAEGLPPDAARACANRAFGNVAQTQERFYETSRWMWLDQLAQDVRYALRGMRANPSFVATTVATLAVGLGLVTIAFTIFNAYVLRPFAVRDPGSLRQLLWHGRNDGGSGFRWEDYQALRERSDLFAAVVAEYVHFASSDGRPIVESLVSPDYFDALGPAVRAGRAFGAGETADVAVLSDEGWARLFNRDASALGRSIELNGRAFTVMGILGPAFSGLGEVPRDVWVPGTSSRGADHGRAGPTRETEITVRLRPGVTAAQAEAALAPFIARAVERATEVRAELRTQSSPTPLTGDLLAVLAPVFAAFALVLVTACANVSNVMLARAITRDREMAVRLSIGASRGRIVRQLLTEGVLIALAAGAGGLALASWGLRAAIAIVFSTLPPAVGGILRFAPVTLDARVFAFACAAAGAATLGFALLPALQASRISPTDVLRGHGSASRTGSRLRNALVAGQVAVALVLVIVAVTLARNGAAIGRLDLGFSTGGVWSVNVRGTRVELARPLAAALARDPRVASIAVTSGNPMFNADRHVAAAPSGGAESKRTPLTFVSPEFFSILEIPIASGRGFRADEAAAAAPIAIVSAATAKAFWPGQDPIGRTIRIERADGRALDEVPEYSGVTVVGTVRDVVSGLIVNGRDGGHIYLPIGPADSRATAMLLRGRGDGDITAASLQEMFRRVAPDPQVFEAVPLAEMRGLQVYPVLAASWVGTLLGAIALVLSISGLYGVLSYVLNQRRREIGIRIALGATARAVVGLVISQSLRLAGIGAAIGGLVAFAALKGLSGIIRLDAITVLDVGAFAGGLAAILAATVVAVYQPARRAAAVDPAQTLRADG